MPRRHCPELRRPPIGENFVLLPRLSRYSFPDGPDDVGNAVVAIGREIRATGSLSRQWEIFLPSFERRERNEHD
jgi:hypothetical protein